jgi:hypothetical protein
VVAQVDTVFGHGEQTDVALVLLVPGLDGIAGLPVLGLTTLTGHLYTP